MSYFVYIVAICSLTDVVHRHRSWLLLCLSHIDTDHEHFSNRQILLWYKFYFIFFFVCALFSFIFLVDYMLLLWIQFGLASSQHGSRLFHILNTFCTWKMSCFGILSVSFSLFSFFVYLHWSNSCLQLWLKKSETEKKLVFWYQHLTRLCSYYSSLFFSISELCVVLEP